MNRENELGIRDYGSTDGAGLISVVGARVNNLKNVSVSLPRNAVSVITGLSGSGKSSLAFDTIFAEGQRRYIETFSAYARGFIGTVERPDVDEITGLSPVISIDQKTTNRNPRSTVGTTTEIYDYLRLLYARASDAYSYNTGERMVRYTDEEIIDLVLREYAGEKIYVLAPVVKNRKGHYRDLFENIRKKGYLYARIDGEIREVVSGLKVDRYRNHDIEIVVDRLLVGDKDRKRLVDDIGKAMNHSGGIAMIVSHEGGEARYFSRNLMCPTTGISYPDPAPHNFSFNSPQGACPHCHGLGVIQQLVPEKIIPDGVKSIADGGIAPLGKYKRTSAIFNMIGSVLAKHNVSLNTPICELGADALDELMYGTRREGSEYGISREGDFMGVIPYLERQQDEDEGGIGSVRQYTREVVCPVCHGARLSRESLHFRIGGKNIAEVADMDVDHILGFLDDSGEYLSERQRDIASEIIKEIRVRLQFMKDVGLHYMSLSRPSGSLSGGESQRIRLATQIGSDLVNVLYILDEPSIGLHQRDNIRLINSLRKLKDMGNTVIVVEHDEQMMRSADYIVDMGPLAGRLGGEVLFEGSVDDMLKTDTMTAQYLNGARRIEPHAVLREGSGKRLSVRGCTGHNLKDVDVEIPLGKLVLVTGVSGSGKSSLINGTLYPILSRHFYRSVEEPLPYRSVEGLEYIDKVVCVDQSPIGRTPRSNPATYTGVFTDIRNLFALMPEAKIRGFKPGRFSFNTGGGRCEQCSGNGYKTIEMHFLPDVYVPCEVCGGKRYNRETLEVLFKGKSIADVLNMTINQAVEFFENQPQILNKIKTLQDVGLGYIKLGQSSTTLSGGESQRVKLATELTKRDTGKTLYILDEPTTGLHFEDIRILMEVIDRLVDKGNTVIIIEHNLDVIRMADHIIDMGPEGGADGGRIVAVGTPREIKENAMSVTGRYL